MSKKTVSVSAASGKTAGKSRRRWVVSALSVVLSVAMLVGTTFAWFSDSASTAVNKVVAGNLDVELFYGVNKEPTGALVWEDASTEDVFSKNGPSEGIKWEPGMVVLSYPLNVVNEGTLALKYKMTIDTVTDTLTTPDGLSLSDVIKIGFLSNEQFQNVERESDGLSEEQKRAAYVKAVKEIDGFMNLSEWSHDGELFPNNQPEGFEGMPHETDAIFLVLYWEPGLDEIDNLYNGKGASITFGIHVDATQTPAESDSFGSKYDGDIDLPSAAARLAAKDKIMNEKGFPFRFGYSSSDNNYPEVSVKTVEDHGIWAKDANIFDYFGEFPGNGTPLVLTGDYSYLHDGNNTSSGMQFKPKKSGSYNIDLNGHKLNTYYVQLTPEQNSDAVFDFSLFNGTFSSPYDQASNLLVDGARNVALSDLVLQTLDKEGKPIDKLYRACPTKDNPGWNDAHGSNGNGPCALIKVRTSGANSKVDITKVGAYGGVNIIDTSGEVNVEDCVFSGSTTPSPDKSGYIKADAEALWIRGNSWANVTMSGTNVSNKLMRLYQVLNAQISNCEIGSGLKLDNSNATLTGCTVVGGVQISGSSQLHIVSGTYDFDPTHYLVSGSNATQQGDKWIVTAGK